MLLGRVLDTKYSKQYGSTWRKDFRVLKQKGTNPQNVLDSRTDNDETGEPETAEDSDSESEQESSDTGTDDETKTKSFLDRILIATRSWSTGGRWEKVLNENKRTESTQSCTTNKRSQRYCCW